jgi:hypothetical protein
MQIQRRQDHVHGGPGVQPVLPHRADRVPGGRRRPLCGAHYGERPQVVDADAAVLGRRVAPQFQYRQAAARALLRPHRLRLRQGVHRQERHPRRMERRVHLPVRGELLIRPGSRGSVSVYRAI